MGGITPEGKVLADCIKLLKILELQKKICHWERINVGMTLNMQGYLQKQGRTGTSDLIVYVPVDETLHILLLEVKRAEGGIQSESQKEFENKFLGLHNVIYSLITDSKKIKELVENVRRKSTIYGKLEEWELPENI